MFIIYLVNFMNLFHVRNYWLVVWNMNGLFSHTLGIMTPPDFPIFSERVMKPPMDLAVPSEMKWDRSIVYINLLLVRE